MKAIQLCLLLFLSGCSADRRTAETDAPSTDNEPFVQGSIRILPPIQKSKWAPLEDGGTEQITIKDAEGSVFEIYVDRRIGTETLGDIYLNDYPGSKNSIRVTNQHEFRTKLDVDD